MGREVGARLGGLVVGVEWEEGCLGFYLVWLGDFVLGVLLVV